MPHQVARWRHLAIKGKDLLLCGKALAIEPCYEVHTEFVPGGYTIRAIQASSINIRCANSKYSAGNYIQNTEIIVTSANGLSARTLFYADLYSHDLGYKNFFWVRSLCFSDTPYKKDGNTLIQQGAPSIDTYPPGSGSWIRPEGGFVVECDGGLELVEYEGGTSNTYTAVDDDNNY